MNRPIPLRSLLSVLCGAVLVIATPLRAQIDPELFSGMKARSVGPAGMSGRIAAIEAVVSNPNVIYVGAATGGLWKSTSGGMIKLGNDQVSQPVEVRPDPRSDVSMEERPQKYDAIVRVGQRTEVITEAVERIDRMKEVAAFREKVQAANFTLFPEQESLNLDWRK